jgi:hypothetical protein
MDIWIWFPKEARKGAKPLVRTIDPNYPDLIPYIQNAHLYKDPVKYVTAEHADKLAEAAAGTICAYCWEKMEGRIEKLAEKFLGWKVPDTVCPDPCVLDKNYKDKMGTNFFNFTEAKEMLRYLLDIKE